MSKDSFWFWWTYVLRRVWHLILLCSMQMSLAQLHSPAFNTRSLLGSRKEMFANWFVCDKLCALCRPWWFVRVQGESTLRSEPTALNTHSHYLRLGIILVPSLASSRDSQQYRASTSQFRQTLLRRKTKCLLESIHNDAQGRTCGINESSNKKFRFFPPKIKFFEELLFKFLRTNFEVLC
jgi:hypothetical protein